MLYKKCKITKYLKLTRVNIYSSETSCDKCVFNVDGCIKFIQMICCDMYPPDKDYNTLGYTILEDRDIFIEI